jgi:hypothetical protein
MFCLPQLVTFLNASDATNASKAASLSHRDTIKYTRWSPPDAPIDVGLVVAIDALHRLHDPIAGVFEDLLLAGKHGVVHSDRDHAFLLCRPCQWFDRHGSIAART